MHIPIHHAALFGQRHRILRDVNVSLLNPPGGISLIGSGKRMPEAVHDLINAKPGTDEQNINNNQA